MKSFDDLKRRLMKNEKFRKIYEGREESARLAEKAIEFREKRKLDRAKMAKMYGVSMKAIEYVEDGISDLPEALVREEMKVLRKIVEGDDKDI